MTRIDSQTAPNRLSGTRLTAWHVGKGASLVGNDELVGLCRDVIHGVPGAVQKLQPWIDKTAPTPGPNGSTTWYSR